MQLKDFYEPVFADIFLEREELAAHAVDVIHSHVVRDTSISRSIKIKFFTAKLLGSVGSDTSWLSNSGSYSYRATSF